MSHFAIFSTAIGRCGIAWGERGVTQVLLPDANDAEIRSRLLRRAPSTSEGVPSDAVHRVIEKLVSLVACGNSDLRDIELDMSGVPSFHRRVYAIARTILPGQTLTYGEVAQKIGVPGSARAVGQALGRNPFALIVPCHRVLAAGGKMGGFSAGGGVATKQRLLEIEGALKLEPFREPLREKHRRPKKDTLPLFAIV